MPKFIIERDLPGASGLSAGELRNMARKSCDILREMGPNIQWLHSYVTGDKVYCVYIAQDEKAILAHAQKGGFPANRVSKVSSVIDPTMSE